MNLIVECYPLFKKKNVNGLSLLKTYKEKERDVEKLKPLQFASEILDSEIKVIKEDLHPLTKTFSSLEGLKKAVFILIYGHVNDIFNYDQLSCYNVISLQYEMTATDLIRFFLQNP